MKQDVQKSPTPERTRFGTFERLCERLVASFAGRLGAGLDLPLAELPTIQQRERLFAVIEQLSCIPNLSQLSGELGVFLNEIHQGLLATSTLERDQAFRRAMCTLRESTVLSKAARHRGCVPDEVSDHDMCVEVAYLELSRAVGRLSQSLHWVQTGGSWAGVQAALAVHEAHRWIVQAGRTIHASDSRFPRDR